MTRRILICGATLAAIGAALAIAAWAFIGWDDSGVDEYPGGVVLRDDAGEVLRVSLGEGDVDCRPYYHADPDDWIVKALVASEDGTFWTHRGVRPLSIVRAACQNAFYRRRISGASTITMQAVRLIRPHPKTMRWKFKEAVMALKMERAHDKRWILSQYLNRAPYGSNFIGIESAASGWFGKSARTLGLGEAALLAGMVQAPSRFRPDRGIDRALRRRDYVLGRMEKLGLITAEQRIAAASVYPAVCRSPRPFKAPYFCDWYLRRLGRDLSVQRRSGDIVTTLNADCQQLAENSVNRAAEDGGYSVAAVIMRVNSGEVCALACSGNYFDATNGQVNTALAARPAGSTLKPFLMALAMDRALVTPEERLADLPKAYRGYRPANFDARHRGLVTARDALVLSLNLPFVELLRRVGVPEFGTCLRGLGFSHLNAPDESYGLGMAIGNVEVSLMELTSAYAVIARGGILPDGTRAFSHEAAYLVSDMLSGEERSAAAFGHVADVPLPRFAWKTGTSSAYRDAWTVAWNPEYVVGVWCGHKIGGFGDQSVVGVKAAAPVALGIARSLCPQDDGPWFVMPESVRTREVCALTGLPANGCCPVVEKGRHIAEVSSNRPCDAHSLGADGKLVVRTPAAQALSILRPADGAEFTLVPGLRQQQVVCQVAGNPQHSRLWWFVDGVAAGETVGDKPLALALPAGDHSISCAAQDGASATIGISVKGVILQGLGVRQ